MARPARFERATAWFVARYSIQLSYGRLYKGGDYPVYGADCQDNRLKGVNIPTLNMARSGITGLRLPVSRHYSLAGARSSQRLIYNIDVSDPALAGNTGAVLRPLTSNIKMAEREGFEPSMGF